MYDRIYAALAIMIALAVAADLLLNGGGACLFLAKKLLDFVQALAFWRH